VAVIPRFGARGAALVSLAASVLAALALLVMVHRVCRILPPAATAARVALACAGAYTAAILWPSSGLAVLVELGVIGAGIVLILVASGEITSSELSTARSWWRGRAQASG
jgi:hypothetical protein